MHSYLTAIGFEKIMNRDDLDSLLNQIMNNPDKVKKYTKDSGTEFIEMSKEFAQGIGIKVVGENDKSGFHFLYYYPYLDSKNESCTQPVFVNRRVDTEAYTGMCEDVRIGVSLIFYLQNAVDYLENAGRDEQIKHPMYLAALAEEGKIILPTAKNEDYKKEMSKRLKEREKLIGEARKGDQEALECLTLEEIDQYSSVSKRIRKEDLFSIIDTTFMPCGSESDIYNIIGIITNVKEVINKATGESVYVMKVEVNNLEMSICVSKAKVYGEPAVGRRFKGTVWLQGKIDFKVS